MTEQSAVTYVSELSTLLLQRREHYDTRRELKLELKQVETKIRSCDTKIKYLLKRFPTFLKIIEEMDNTTEKEN